MHIIKQFKNKFIQYNYNKMMAMTDIEKLDNATLKQIYNLYQKNYKSTRVYDTKTASAKFYNSKKDDLEYMTNKNTYAKEQYHKHTPEKIFLTDAQKKDNIKQRNKINYETQKAKKVNINTTNTNINTTIQTQTQHTQNT